MNAGKDALNSFSLSANFFFLLLLQFLLFACLLVVVSALRAWYATMSSIPEVAKYMKERPQTGSGIGMADGTGVGMPNSIIVSTDTPSDLDVVKSAIGAGAAPASGA